MARLTRKFLTALGIEDENVQDQIISAHTEATDALKEQRDGYKADAEKLPEVQKELDTLKEQSGDKIKAQYDKLKKDFDNYKEEQHQKEVTANKKSAYKGLLKEAGISASRIDAVLKVSDVDGLEFSEDGEIKDKDKMIENIKKEWADFIVKSTEKGAQVGNPPANGGKALSREEILKIKDTSERQKAIAENLSAFGR